MMRIRIMTIITNGNRKIASMIEMITLATAGMIIISLAATSGRHMREMSSSFAHAIARSTVSRTSRPSAAAA